MRERLKDDHNPLETEPLVDAHRLALDGADANAPSTEHRVRAVVVASNCARADVLRQSLPRLAPTWHCCSSLVQTNLIQLGRVDCVQPARLSIDGDGVAVLDGHVVCRAGL